MQDLRNVIIEKFKVFGTGHRKLDDDLFSSDEPPLRLGIYDEDDENLCHEVLKSTCHIPGCRFTAETLLDFENHYNATHRYSCSQCKKVLPSPHLLDLHIQEKHDSFFAVSAAKKPSYCCFIEECHEKFMNADDRREHCVTIHRLPKDFRFDNKPKITVKKSKKKKTDHSMEVEREKEFTFTNSKQKAFVKYTGKRFVKDESERSKAQDVSMDDVMDDLRNSLPK